MREEQAWDAGRGTGCVTSQGGLQRVNEDPHRVGDDIKAILSDHDGQPTSICRHPNDHPTSGEDRSVVSVIVEPDAGRMHLTRGNPCDNPYEVYSLD